MAIKSGSRVWYKYSARVKIPATFYRNGNDCAVVFDKNHYINGWEAEIIDGLRYNLPVGATNCWSVNPNSCTLMNPSYLDIFRAKLNK